MDWQAIEILLKTSCNYDIVISNHIYIDIETDEWITIKFYINSDGIGSSEILNEYRKEYYIKNGLLYPYRVKYCGYIELILEELPSTLYHTYQGEMVSIGTIKSKYLERQMFIDFILFKQSRRDYVE